MDAMLLKSMPASRLSLHQKKCKATAHAGSARHARLTNDVVKVCHVLRTQRPRPRCELDTCQPQVNICMVAVHCGSSIPARISTCLWSVLSPSCARQPRHLHDEWCRPSCTCRIGHGQSWPHLHSGSPAMHCQVPPGDAAGLTLKPENP